MSREAMQMALDAFDYFFPTEDGQLWHTANDVKKIDDARQALQQALETEHEPVAWANSYDLQNFDMKVRTGPDLHHTVPLYTAPPKQWVGLTDDVVFELADTNLYEGGKNFGVLAFAKAIEQALKEKNT